MKSEKFRLVINKGYQGIKPGWTRVNLHYSIPEYELNFILDAIDFISQYGHIFLTQYQFNVLNGEWNHKSVNTSKNTHIDAFNMKEVSKIDYSKEESIDESKRQELYDSYLQEAKELTISLQQEYITNFQIFEDKNMEELRFFNFIKS